MRRRYDHTDIDSFLRRVSVCPVFHQIHFKPKALMDLFQHFFRDLVLAYQKFDEQVAKMVFKYFVEHRPK